MLKGYPEKKKPFTEFDNVAYGYNSCKEAYDKEILARSETENIEKKLKKIILFHYEGFGEDDPEHGRPVCIDDYCPTGTCKKIAQTIQSLFREGEK